MPLRPRKALAWGYPGGTVQRMLLLFLVVATCAALVPSHVYIDPLPSPPPPAHMYMAGRQALGRLGALPWAAGGNMVAAAASLLGLKY